MIHSEKYVVFFFKKDQKKNFLERGLTRTEHISPSSLPLNQNWLLAQISNTLLFAWQAEHKTYALVTELEC